MKSSDEIKKGLEVCGLENVSCNSVGRCPYESEFCDYGCVLKADAIALVQQLEADKKQLEGMLTHMNQLRDAAAGRALKMEERARQFEKDNDQLRNYVRLLQAERDALIYDIEEYCAECALCKHYSQEPYETPCNNCRHMHTDAVVSMWEWRGVQKEATS